MSRLSANVHRCPWRPLIRRVGRRRTDVAATARSSDRPWLVGGPDRSVRLERLVAPDSRCRTHCVTRAASAKFSSAEAATSWSPPSSSSQRSTLSPAPSRNPSRRASGASSGRRCSGDPSRFGARRPRSGQRPRHPLRPGGDRRRCVNGRVTRRPDSATQGIPSR